MGVRERRVLAGVALILLLTYGGARAQSPKAPAPGAVSDESAIRLILDRQTEAWNKGDLEGFMQGYWKSRNLTFYSGGTITRGWKATLNRYRQRYKTEGNEMGKLDFPEETIEFLGPRSALVRERWRLRLSSGREMRGLSTLVMRRLPEGWRIVHDHSSAE